jgi:two-component system, sensor histidine kinase ChiS
MRTGMFLKLLMIDDERLCLEMMEVMLDGTGYHLATAEGGVAGLTYVNDNPGMVDIILLDMMMPDMYGLDVLTQIKNNPATNHIPVIIQSGVANEQELQKAADLGAAHNLRKPFKKADFLAVLKKVVG